MSLVRSVTPYGNRELYLLDGNNNDKRQIIYATPSYSNESYDPKYFLDSPTEDLVHQLMPAQQLFNSPFVRDSDNLESGYLLRQRSPEGILSYDEDRMRLKLQELERELLEDSNIEDDRSMEVDGAEWADDSALLHDSPKESSLSSGDSYVSSISSNKEISLVTTPRTPKQLLFECAAQISEGNFDESSVMIHELRQRVSIQGEPRQRIAAYMVEALAARVAMSGKGLYKALKCKEPPSSDRLSAMQVLFEVCPCFRFGFMAANAAMLEAFKGEKQVHIIDFDISQGSQYITLLQTLADQYRQTGSRSNFRPPHLKLTGVDDPESVQRPVGGLNHIGLRLEKLAESLNLPFEFEAVAANTAVVKPEMLNCQHGKEAIIVNFAFQLHHMPDESVSIVNQRDQLLRLVKSLNPKLVTVVEQDLNTNTSPFLPRFGEVYNYYSAMFDSLDATLSRESQDRLNVEKQCLAKDIVNIIACEGEERIERYEVAGKWKARMTMAGFHPSPISLNVKDTIRKLIKQYSERFKVEEEMNALHFGWEDKVLIVTSAWK